MNATIDPTDRTASATGPAPAVPGAAATASGPGTSAPGAAVTAATTPRTGNRWGRISLILGLVSLLGGGIVAGLIGSTIAQQQAEAGRFLSDTPESYQTLVALGMGSFVLWSLIALAALVTGIVALVRKECLGGALTGIVTGLFAPAVWFAAFAIPAMVMASTIG